VSTATALWSRPFIAYSLTNGSAYVAMWMQRLALGWMVWTLTHSAAWLGWLAVCDLAPALVFGPIGGVLGDRGRVDRLIAWTQALIVANTALSGLLVWSGAPAWALIASALTGGAVMALGDAPRAMVVTALAPPQAAGAAVAITAVTINIARFVGPAIAGVIAASSDVATVFLVAVLLGLPLVVHAAMMRIAATTQHASVHWLRGIADGVRYAAGDRVLAIVLAAFIASCVFARGLYEQLPGIANELFGRGITGLSALTTGLGLGAVLAGLLMTMVRGTARAARLSFAGAALAGVAALGLGVAPSFPVAVFATAALGFGVSAVAIAVQVVVQIDTRPDMRNRVLSLWSMIVRAGPALGALAVGFAADRVGFHIPLLVAGAVAVAAALLGWLALARSRPVARDIEEDGLASPPREGQEA